MSLGVLPTHSGRINRVPLASPTQAATMKPFSKRSILGPSNYGQSSATLRFGQASRKRDRIRSNGFTTPETLKNSQRQPWLLARALSGHPCPSGRPRRGRLGLYRPQQLLPAKASGSAGQQSVHPVQDFHLCYSGRECALASNCFGLELHSIILTHL